MKPSAVALAYCRPKMMRRIVHFLGQIQIKELFFFRPYLSDKSYENSSFYSEEEILSSYQLGLDQVRKSQSPNIYFAREFRPFLEDILLTQYGPDSILVTDPDAESYSAASGEIIAKLLLFGPERGFTELELNMIRKKNLKIHSFGSSHLRLESAVPYIFGGLAALK